MESNDKGKAPSQETPSNSSKEIQTHEALDVLASIAAKAAANESDGKRKWWPKILPKSSEPTTSTLSLSPPQGHVGLLPTGRPEVELSSENVGENAKSAYKHPRKGNARSRCTKVLANHVRAETAYIVEKQAAYIEGHGPPVSLETPTGAVEREIPENGSQSSPDDAQAQAAKQPPAETNGRKRHRRRTRDRAKKRGSKAQAVDPPEDTCSQCSSTTNAGSEKGPEKEELGTGDHIPSDDKKLSKEDYAALIINLRAELVEKLNDQFNVKYASCVAALLGHVSLTGNQYRHILKQRRFFFHDADVFKGTPCEDDGPTATPYASGEFRQGVPQKRKVTQRVPALVQAVIDGYNEKYSDIIRGNGVVNNAHLHTSVLKRYMSTMIKQNRLNSFAIVGQNWLSNAVNGGNCVLTGAFIGKVLEDEAERLADAKIPILAVIQHYSPGLHIGDEMSYICDKEGNVIGTSNGGTKDFWTDKNVDIPYSGEWHGMNVHTLVELGSQRLIYINHTRPTPPVYKDYVKNDSAYEISGMDHVTHGSYHYYMGLSSEEEDEDTTGHRRIVGFDPFLSYVCHTPEPDPLPSRLKRIIRRKLRGTRLYGWYRGCRQFLGLPAPEFDVYLNPNLCQFPVEDDHLYQLYYSNPIDPVTGLPFGVYKLQKNSIVQLHFGDQSANYTNIWPLFKAYSVSKGFSEGSVYKDLVRRTCNMHPCILPDSAFSFQPVFESPLEPITARRPYRVQIKEVPGFSVKLFSEEELRTFVVNYVTKKAVSAAASWRVVRAGLQSVVPKGTLLAEYKRFWRKAVCGGTFDVITDTDDIPDVSHFTGKKRRKYQLLLDTLGTRFAKACYKLFCKMEALPLASVLKKAVRIISPNNPMFNLIVLSFFLKFEDKLLQTKSPLGQHYFAKGLNYEQRWRTIRALAKRYKYCYSIDFKNFDAHHCDDNYLQEIMFYKAIGLPDKYVEQLINARHTGVISYKALMRCSGDLFTGSGNCLTVGALLFPFCGKNFTFFCDGDDTLLFFNQKDDYEKVRLHLFDRGYELGPPEKVSCDRKDRNGDFTYAIPFCQVLYHYDYYEKDLDRLLNKCGNLSGASTDAIARTILGKLQSFCILKAHGVKFDIDIMPYLNGLDDNYELDYKKFLITNLTHYQAINPRSFNWKIEDSLIANIARKFESNKVRIYTTMVANRPKLLVKLIKEVLEDEFARQTGQNITERELSRTIAARLDDEGFRAITPVLTNIYRELVREYTTFEIMPPQVPTENQTLLYANGHLYT